VRWSTVIRMVAALGLIAICALTQQLPFKQVIEKLVRGPVCIDQVKPGLSSFARVRGHQQVTDVYLLTLALSRTFSPVRPLSRRKWPCASKRLSDRHGPPAPDATRL